MWAWASCTITEDYEINYGNSLDGFMDFCRGKRYIVYFHNLKFDGNFIIYWLFTHGFEYNDNSKKLESNEFSTLISDTGQFYSIEIMFSKSADGKHNDRLTIYDSLKIIPLSVDALAKAFNLPISKLKIDYKEKREIGHVLTEEEIAYIQNDVKIVAMALKYFFDMGLTKITIGSNALNDYKTTVGIDKFDYYFPIPLYDSEVRKSYKGGYTNVLKSRQNKPIGEGLVFDVNSLYPSVMYYNKLPYGCGQYFESEYEQDNLYDLYITHLTFQFELRENHIPCIQIKRNLSFVETDYLTDSGGEDVELWLTSVDWKLIQEQYYCYNINYIDGWKFRSTDTLFKPYIDKWMKVKQESTLNGNKGMRQISKLMLNSLYGKFALNPECRSKIPLYDADQDKVKYKFGEKENRNPIYIPVGTFITAGARFKTISSAQFVYPYFAYADTDSMHLEISLPSELTELSPDEFSKLTSKDFHNAGVTQFDFLDIDPVKLGAWKSESHFKRAKFLRQKSYIEDEYISNKDYETYIAKHDFHAHMEEGKYLYQKITCAGMPSTCYSQVTWDNFAVGSIYTGKLQPVVISGGVILEDRTFKIKGRKKKKLLIP